MRTKISTGTDMPIYYPGCPTKFFVVIRGLLTQYIKLEICANGIKFQWSRNDKIMLQAVNAFRRNKSSLLSLETFASNSYNPPAYNMRYPKEKKNKLYDNAAGYPPAAQ
jgi:hypothetical protein